MMSTKITFSNYFFGLDNRNHILSFIIIFLLLYKKFFSHHFNCFYEDFDLITIIIKNLILIFFNIQIIICILAFFITIISILYFYIKFVITDKKSTQYIKFYFQWIREEVIHLFLISCLYYTLYPNLFFKNKIYIFINSSCSLKLSIHLFSILIIIYLTRDILLSFYNYIYSKS